MGTGKAPGLSMLTPGGSVPTGEPCQRPHPVCLGAELMKPQARGDEHLLKQALLIMKLCPLLDRKE